MHVSLLSEAHDMLGLLQVVERLVPGRQDLPRRRVEVAVLIAPDGKVLAVVLHFVGRWPPDLVHRLDLAGFGRCARLECVLSVPAPPERYRRSSWCRISKRSRVGKAEPSHPRRCEDTVSHRADSRK
ncbi:hypothetical protein GCM10010404_34950 [Nonomuraea africana]